MAYWFRDFPAPGERRAAEGLRLHRPGLRLDLPRRRRHGEPPGCTRGSPRRGSRVAPGDTQLLVAFSGKLGTVEQRPRARLLGARQARGRHASAVRLAHLLLATTAGPGQRRRLALRQPADPALPGRLPVPAGRRLDPDRLLRRGPDSRSLDPFFVPAGCHVSGHSKLPYLDDIRLYQLGVDRDHDGVADALDACPDSCAAGQDADGDGCVDATATMRHVESWDGSAPAAALPDLGPGDPRINDGSDFTAITNGFAAWARGARGEPAGGPGTRRPPRPTPRRTTA